MSSDDETEQIRLKADVDQYFSIRYEFLNFIAEVNGTVFDAQEAYQMLLAKQLLQQQELDGKRDVDGTFSFEDWLRYASQQVLMERNIEGGTNLRFIGNYCIVTIYQFWEENIRPRMASALGIDKNLIRHDVLGDVRAIRNAIIHHQGTATDEVAKNKAFRWYKKDDVINIDKEKYFEISEALCNVLLEHTLLSDVEISLSTDQSA